jgi:hypothetical protein
MNASSSAIGDGQQGMEINIVERPLTDSATAYSRPEVDCTPQKSRHWPTSLWRPRPDIQNRCVAVDAVKRLGA